MRRVAWCGAILLALMIFNCLPAMAANQAAEKKEAARTSLFPFIQGWHWQYNHIAEEFDQDGNALVDPWNDKSGRKVRVKRVKETTRSEITALSENQDFILAEIATDSKDIDTNETWKSEKCLILHKPTGYLWQGEKTLKDDYWAGKLAAPKEPMLILPLKVGQHWGYNFDFKRIDFWYQWYVEAEEKITVPAGTFKCFRLAFRTNPDHRIIWFCPEVGIIKKEYVHHGTIIQTFNELASYGLKK